MCPKRLQGGRTPSVPDCLGQWRSNRKWEPVKFGYLPPPPPRGANP
ncbi:unnamed protein product [Staurois parvus]|uniref:Uncharacterized protein n=1 Tax=Staurois parvus TaxID=386267 RepID=A0ABN9A8Y6_9NEOB|nr:unnamed protein product [Staurois parvus]